MLAVLLLAAIATPTLGEESSPTGLDSCKCVEWSGLDQYVVNGKLMYTPADSSTSYAYPSTYGNMECKAHDQGLPPFCDTPSPPAWCGQQWCYIDRDQCTGVQVYKSSLFPGSNVYYSYATCGASNQFKVWFDDSSGGQSLSALVDVLQGYLWSTREMLESVYINLTANDLLQGCEYSEQCPCLECYHNELWGAKADFADVGAWIRPSSTTAQRNMISCLTKGIAQSYSRIAAKEGEPSKRVGYQYFADQMTGSYVGWPNVDWCLGDFDPRFRPWYSSGSTGPKDIVIVVDVSGSMSKNGRSELAKQAAAAVLDTLEWRDYASIVLFNQAVSAEYSSTLVPVDNCERQNMKQWLELQSWQDGGTDFRTALTRAFEIIRASVSAGETSMCQKAIIFLTDGQADFTDSDFANMRELSVRYDTTMFTYALGSGAETTKTKRLACENRGIFYSVPDGGNLKNIMSKYYEYFSAGQQVCTPSFTRYADAVTGKYLWPACLPLYDRAQSQPKLLGVTCLDLNVMADPEEMQQRADWHSLVCKASDMTKQCRPMEMSECLREKLRGEYSYDSMCDSVNPLPATCPCTDPTCKDDDEFIDELGYFCDTWIGDDCDKADTDWGYSYDGKIRVLQKCKRSCGKCSLLDPCPYTQSPACQQPSTSSASCRACRTDKVSGLDIQGHPMQCSGGDFATGAKPCAASTGSAVAARAGLVMIWLFVPFLC